MTAVTKTSRYSSSFYANWLRTRKLFLKHKSLARTLLLCIIVIAILSVWKYSNAQEDLKDLEKKFRKQSALKSNGRKMESQKGSKRTTGNKLLQPMMQDPEQLNDEADFDPLCIFLFHFNYIIGFVVSLNFDWLRREDYRMGSDPIEEGHEEDTISGRKRQISKKESKYSHKKGGRRDLISGRVNSDDPKSKPRWDTLDRSERVSAI